MIPEDRYDAVVGWMSASIEDSARRELAVAVLPPGTDLLAVGIRLAFRVGLEAGLRITAVDRIGAEIFLDAIDAYVHRHDAESIEQSRRDARKVLEELYR